MKNTFDVLRTKKTTTFDAYFDKRSAQTEKIIEQTLRVVDPTKYSNLTDYCKAVAHIISEIRAAKAGDPSTPFYNKTVRPFSYVTLLRNENYRRLVGGMFDHSRGTLEQPEVVSEAAILKIASLNAQLNLLKDRLSATKTSPGSNALADASAQENILELSEFLAITLEVYTKLRSDFEGLTRLITTPTDKYPVGGLYSSYGLVAETDVLQKIELGRKFLSKSPKALGMDD
ncbi:MAG TPA: hypothetical protein VF682_20805 [Pseudomonas sp.]|jgi:hypothetical protein